MAPNGKPLSYVMQHQRSPLQSIIEVAPPKDKNIQVKNECILFSQSIMSGRWNPTSSVQPTEPAPTNTDGPEPRILSKKRRDLINAEIRELQNLLPLKKSARERLSYLGILALTNTFIRKATFFKKECISCDNMMSCGLVPEFSSSLCGFLLVFNRDGKILYSSDNILDYLGNTVVELASQGDSIFDFVDKDDHDQIRAQLDVPPHNDHGEGRELSFFCRMSTSRYMKTQMRSWKNKIVHVTGRYHRPEMSNDWSDTVFFAVCTPVESKPVSDVRHHPSPRATEFKVVHGPDMKFLEVPNTVQAILGYKPEELENTSWYQWVYPEDLPQAKQQHLKFVKEEGSAFACVVRLIKKDGSYVWMDITAEKSQESIANSFVCNYIAINEEDVPYFRIHHNFLPFPEHYTDEQRQYLAYRSTLLSAALTTESSSSTTSPMTSPGATHVDGSHYPMAFGENVDTKSILRRQLIKRKMSSVESPAEVGSPYGPDVFAMPPNKMLIRATSEMQYPAVPSYHAPLQHSTSYPEASYHPQMLYKHGADETFLSQLHGGATPPSSYLYEGGYTTLAPVRPQALTIRGISHQSNSNPSSPNGNQLNQNNNVYHRPSYQPYMANNNPQYSPAHSVSSPAHETEYYQQGSPACSQSSPRPQQRKVSKGSAPMRQSVDNLFRDMNEVIESDVCIGTSNQISYSNNHSPVYQQSVHSPQGMQNNTAMYGNQVSCSNNVNMCPTLKEEVHSPNMRRMMSPATTGQYSPQSYYPSSNYGDISPSRSSPGFQTPCIAENFSGNSLVGKRSFAPCGDRPYQLQYSISQAQPNMQQYQAAAEWMKKYGNMSAMEMLFSESESAPYLA